MKRNNSGKHKQHEDHVPDWLQWTLAVLIVINILSYFVVTWYTIHHINQQISQLRNTSTTRQTSTTTDSSIYNMRNFKFQNTSKLRGKPKIIVEHDCNDLSFIRAQDNVEVSENIWNTVNLS